MHVSTDRVERKDLKMEEQEWSCISEKGFGSVVCL